MGHIGDGNCFLYYMLYVVNFLNESTKKYLDKRSGDRNAVGRLQVLLEEDGVSQQQTEMDGVVCVLCCSCSNKTSVVLCCPMSLIFFCPHYATICM